MKTKLRKKPKPTAETINQLRQSFQIQRLLERDARGGTRYLDSTMIDKAVKIASET